MLPSQSSREVEGIVVIAGLGGGLVILLPLLAVFIKFYKLLKTPDLNLTTIAYVTYNSSFVTISFTSQLFNLCVATMSDLSSVSLYPHYSSLNSW